MVRKLILALTILAVAAVPVPALARDHVRGFHGGREFHARHERFEQFHHVRHFVGAYAYPYYAYAPPACYWQPGYRINRPYVDAWGRYVYVRQWVPAQYVCD